MVCFHKRYDLGDKHEYRKGDYSSWAALLKEIIRREDPICLKPLYLYDHSEITIRTYPFDCPWDSGQVGFVFITRDTAKRELSANETFIERLEVDPEAAVSKADPDPNPDPDEVVGAYVQAWVWVCEEDIREEDAPCPS
jgi:hypothetical protein